MRSSDVCLVGPSSGMQVHHRLQGSPVREEVNYEKGVCSLLQAGMEAVLVQLSRRACVHVCVCVSVCTSSCLLAISMAGMLC